MLLEPVDHLSLGSHKKVKIKCDYSLSENCKQEYFQEYREITKRQKEKTCCYNCELLLRKKLRKRNGNLKYGFDELFFESIDTEFKSYFLGWIASDGSVKKNTITIELHSKDTEVLKCLKDGFYKELKIVSHRGKSSLTINSCKIVENVCKHLQINNYGKKCRIVSFPTLENDSLSWAFLRGFFDGDGSIVNPSLRKSSPACSLSTSSNQFVYGLTTFLHKFNFKFNVNYYKKTGCFSIGFSGSNCLDFLGKIYGQASFYLERKHTLYYRWSLWIPSMLTGRYIRGKTEIISWNKTRVDAVAPQKSFVTNSGYDLTLIERLKIIGEVEYYNTGLKMHAPYGWYFQLHPRSSTCKLGYMLANNVGIIDRSYTGEIIAPLIKIDKTKPDLVLPNRAVQVVPTPIAHFEVIEVNQFEDTSRSGGGFGSTEYMNKLHEGIAFFKHKNRNCEIQSGHYKFIVDLVKNNITLTGEDNTKLKELNWFEETPGIWVSHGIDYDYFKKLGGYT